MTEADVKNLARQHFDRAMAEAEDMRLRQRIPAHDPDIHYRLDPHDAMLDTYDEVVGIAQDDLDRNCLGHVAEDVDAILTASGIVLDRNSPAWRKLAHYTLRANLEIAKLTRDRAYSLFDTDPADPVVAPCPAGSVVALNIAGNTPAPGFMAEAQPTLQEIYERYKAERRPAAKTIAKFDTAVARFNSLHGDMPIDSITKAHVREFKAAMLKMPRALPGPLRDLPLRDVLAQVDGRSDLERLSGSSVNALLGSIGTLLSWAVQNGYLEANPFSGMKVRESKTSSETRLPYSTADLGTIFNSPVYRGRKSLARSTVPGPALIRNADFWLPMLGAFTGARLNELGQLQVADVRQDNGIHYIDINTVGDGKTIKTNESRRKVPLHPELIRCGFLAYVDQQQQAGHDRVFSELKPDCKGHLTGNWSKWWGRYARDIGITDNRKVFHSFRHGFKDACRAAGIEEAVFDALMGHSSASVSRRYGQGYPLARLAEAMASVRYDNLDVGHLHVAE
ncbi:site-specific integrase [Skermanella mucosa]|uniref:site-specific integrase n=1 Tax=Skermanella mucosa TaxID=1789672 RepID=UPI001E617B4A|nr:site-specific integrase [Skermanella mucosa]UEM23064.1 site-specific integrase [Skermanella mucosa]